MNKEVKYRDGSVDIINISSDDNLKVKLKRKYVLVGYEGNKYVDNFRNSIFGMDIGINSNAFASKIIISLLIVILMILGMYLAFKI